MDEEVMDRISNIEHFVCSRDRGLKPPRWNILAPQLEREKLLFSERFSTYGTSVTVF